MRKNRKMHGTEGFGTLEDINGSGTFTEDIDQHHRACPLRITRA